MHELIKRLFSNGLMPHGFCYQWKPALIWLHAVSDTTIALAYFLIPLALLYFVRKRRDIPFGWMFVCFGGFIAACGATHIMDVWTLWIPSYWLSGGVKLITAFASVPTAVFLVRIMPAALSLPTSEELRTANEKLRLQAGSLKASEERFRQMADNIQEIFWMMNPATKEVNYVSPAFEKICELPLESLYSNPTSYRELIHPQDRQRVLEELEKLESTNRFDEEFRIVCPSGRVKWLRGIGFTAQDSTGAVRTLVGTAQEITNRKEMEVFLRESEDRYRDLVENSTDLICTYNLQGNLLSVNEQPVKLLGYSREELLATPMRNLLLPEARAQFDESLVNIQRDGFVKGLMVVLTKTGERRIWEYHNTLRTEGVAVPIVRGIAHDVTDQKHLERALQLSEEKFSKAFRNSPNLVSITRLQDGLVLDVNESFEKQTGYSRNELLGRTKLEVGLWIDPSERKKLVRGIEEQGFVRDQEIHFRSKSGQVAVFQIAVEQIKLRGERCLLTVGQDITLRKRAEDELRQAQQRIESLLDSMTDAHILLDHDWHYLYVNEAAVRATGRTRKQILGYTLWETNPEIADSELGRRYHHAMDRRLSATFDFHDLALDAWWEYRFYPAPEGLAVFATDITERKRAEEKLREYEKVVEGLEEMILVVDREYRLRLVNRAYLNYRGGERTQLVGCLLPDVLDNEVFDRDIKPKLDECFQGKVVHDQLRYLYPHLGERDLRVSYFPIEGPHGIDRAAGVIRDVTEHMRAELELQRLSGQLLRLQDEERRRIARELHDSTGQDLVAMATFLSQVRSSIPTSARKPRKLASQCGALMDHCIREVRTLSYLLYPPMLDESGLTDAIRHYVVGFFKRTGIKIELAISPLLGRLTPDKELALFRVVQESLTNVQRHSGRFIARVQLERRPKMVLLEVSDKGNETSGKVQKKNERTPIVFGVGIRSMQERVKLIGGRFDIDSCSSGTTVRVTVPVDA